MRSDGRRKGPQHDKGIPRQIAEETGLSVDTVRRALNPRPIDIKSVLPAESEAEAIIREANAIVSAWNRARQEARELALEQIDAPVFDRSRARQCCDITKQQALGVGCRNPSDRFASM